MATPSKYTLCREMSGLSILPILLIGVYLGGLPTVSAVERSSVETCGLAYYDGPTPSRSEQVKLGVLKPGFRIAVGAMAPLGYPEVLVYLMDSKKCRVISQLNTPHDLTGYVSIDSPEQCLEYLRFFSLPETFSLTGNEYVEISFDSSDASTTRCWNLVDSAVWLKYSIPPARAFPAKVELSCGQLPAEDNVPQDGFRCVRPVLFVSNDVFLVTEDVLPDGQWALVKKEKLSATADDLGVWFLLH